MAPPVLQTCLLSGPRRQANWSTQNTSCGPLHTFLTRPWRDLTRAAPPAPTLPLKVGRTGCFSVASLLHQGQTSAVSPSPTQVLPLQTAQMALRSCCRPRVSLSHSHSLLLLCTGSLAFSLDSSSGNTARACSSLQLPLTEISRVLLRERRGNALHAGTDRQRARSRRKPAWTLELWGSLTLGARHLRELRRCPRRKRTCPRNPVVVPRGRRQIARTT